MLRPLPAMHEYIHGTPAGQRIPDSLARPPEPCLQWLMEPDRLSVPRPAPPRGRRLGAIAISLVIFCSYASLSAVSSRSYRVLSGLAADFSAARLGLLAGRMDASGQPAPDWAGSLDDTAAGSAVARFSALSSLFWFRKASEPSKELTDAWARWKEARGSAAGGLAGEGLERSLAAAALELESMSLRVHQSFETMLLLFGLAMSLGYAGSVAYYARMRESDLVALHARDALRLSLRAEEETRKTVAMELHDDVAQDIAAARMLCERAAAERSPGLAERAAGTLAGANAKLRSLSADLSPPELDKFGLAGALAGLCADAARKSGCEIRYRGREWLPRFPRETELNAYRMVREAVANAIKHGRDGRAWVSARETGGGAVELEILDSGHDPAGGPRAVGKPEATRGTGFGMRAMAERAAMIGAGLAVDLRPEGSRVTIQLAGRADGEPSPDVATGSDPAGSGEDA